LILQCNRKGIFNAGMIPNIPENPRNRKGIKRGRKRLFNAAIHALRTRVERTFAWEDKFKNIYASRGCYTAMRVAGMGEERTGDRDVYHC
jgi:hypothetical protein